MQASTTEFLAQLLKQLEAGQAQEAADAIQLRLHYLGYFTPQIKVGSKDKHG